MKKICEKNFRALFLNMYIFEVVTFVFSPSAYPINSIFQLSNQLNFSGQYLFIRFMFLMKHFPS